MSIEYGNIASISITIDAIIHQKLSFIEKVSLEDKKRSNRSELERTKAMIKSMEKGNERLFKLILKILE